MRKQKVKAAVVGEGALLSVDEAHRILGRNSVTKAALYMAVQRGEIPGVRLGKRVLINRAGFERWLTGGEPEAA